VVVVANERSVDLVASRDDVAIALEERDEGPATCRRVLSADRFAADMSQVCAEGGRSCDLKADVTVKR
jgi:hypothetical protein